MERRKKGVTKCVPNEKRRQDEKEYSFPGGTSLTFKEPFRGSCTSVPFQPNSSSPTNNKHCQRAGQFSSNSQQFSTWPKLFNSANLKLIHPGVSHCAEEYVGVLVNCLYANVCLNQCVPACRLLCHLLHDLSSHDIN